jgi:hypothetical protein
MSLVLRFPRLSDWIVERLRRFPWLLTRLAAVARTGSTALPAKPLIAPDLTPATREVLEQLEAELARAHRGSR